MDPLRKDYIRDPTVTTPSAKAGAFDGFIRIVLPKPA